MKTREGLQTGPDIASSVIGTIVASCLVLLLAVRPAPAGIQDGPDVVTGVVVDDGVPFKSAEFRQSLTPPTLDSSTQSCTSRDMDNCWSDCEAYADSLSGSYVVNRIDCRIQAGRPACSCTIGIPGPYYPPIYWPGIGQFDFGY